MSNETTHTIQTEDMPERAGYSIVSNDDIAELLESANGMAGDIKKTVICIVDFLRMLGMIDELGNLCKIQPGALASLTTKLVFGGKKEQDKAFKPLNDLEPLLEKYKHFLND